MQEAQKPIAEWMTSMMAKHAVSARAWSVSSGLGKDTVSRALRADYGFVTSTATLVKLADALNERGPAGAATIPSVESLSGILDVLCDTLIPGQALPPPVVHSLASALRDTLLHLADEPEAHTNLEASQLLARAAVRQLQR